MTERAASAPELSDDELLAALQDLTLPPSSFDHRGHLRLAWILLQRSPLPEAVARACEGIRAYAAHLGATQKFHHTLTEALMRLMHARRAADPALGWEAFLAENEELVRDARGLIRRHYSDELLASDAARTAFVSPDREPLPPPCQPAP